MDLNIVLITTILLISPTKTEETFENSTNLCQRCMCIKESTFMLDCQLQSFQHMIGNWPEHNTTMIATFSYNNLTHLELLPSSDFVTKVVLSYCGIKSMDDGAFKAAKNLKYLDLSHNLLTLKELRPEKFKGPYNNAKYEPLLIEVLILSFNQIHSLPKNLFEHLTSLKELNLEGNDFKVLDQPTQLALSKLQNLEVLNLADNELTELVNDAIGNLTKLRVLNLSKNLLDFVPETLTNLGSLEILYLDDNRIFEITDESFIGIKRIKILSLTHLSKLQYVNANSFAPMTNLTILHLSDNPMLETINRDAFGPKQHLQKLFLHNNRLTDLHYNLTDWTSLKMFTIQENDLLCDCDLWNISRKLSSNVKANQDGPFCFNPKTDKSLMLSELTEEACDFVNPKRQSELINHQFGIIKITLLVTSGLISFITMIALVVAFLRYRRFRMNRNYPFVTQVMYNPLRSPLGN